MQRAHRGQQRRVIGETSRRVVHQRIAVQREVAELLQLAEQHRRHERQLVVRQHQTGDRNE